LPSLNFVLEKFTSSLYLFVGINSNTITQWYAMFWLLCIKERTVSHLIKLKVFQCSSAFKFWQRICQLSLSHELEQLLAGEESKNNLIISSS